MWVLRAVTEVGLQRREEDSAYSGDKGAYQAGVVAGLVSTLHREKRSTM